VRRPLTKIVEQNVVVFSSDQVVRGQVEAAVAAKPGARTVFVSADDGKAWRPLSGDRVVVIDDEGVVDADALVREVKARNAQTLVVYLAARHSLGVERKARQAGASWYAIKPAPGRDLERVITTLLRT
jgi:DNA-binding response OmpR family regulator